MTDTIAFEETGQIGEIEFRKYPELVLATVHDPGDDSGFSQLFGYISGRNRIKGKIPMTAPVMTSEQIPMTTPVITSEQIPMTTPVITSEKIPMTTPVITSEQIPMTTPVITSEQIPMTPPVITSEKIPMTTPVITSEQIPMTTPVITSEKIPMTTPVITSEKIPMTAPVVSGEHTMSFVMPAGKTLQEMPEPMDTRVELSTLPPGEIAVIRFRGYARRHDVEAVKTRLLDGLKRAGIATRGRPFLMRYNAPWTPGFLRRNEVGIEVTR
jgi:hypothetical protein